MGSGSFLTSSVVAALVLLAAGVSASRPTVDVANPGRELKSVYQKTTVEQQNDDYSTQALPGVTGRPGEAPPSFYTYLSIPTNLTTNDSKAANAFCMSQGFERAGNVTLTPNQTTTYTVMCLNCGLMPADMMKLDARGNFGTDNIGFNNVGFRNNGSYNCGTDNVGSFNLGFRNVGSGNWGSENAGSGNVGNRNQGNGNYGDENVGNGNTGSRNNGNGNRGQDNGLMEFLANGNTGDRNVGNGNNGTDNVGNGNVGYRAIGNGITSP